MGFTSCDCRYRCRCALAALILSVVVGVVTAFLQITGVITVTPVFLWVAFGIGVVYLPVTALVGAMDRRTEDEDCRCRSVNTLLIGILGTILLALVLLAVGIVATSILSAILVGLLLFFFTLMVAGTVCFVRNLLGCGS